MDAGYAIAEFYLSLIAYYVLHMIFVIASDFVEAFNIPPLNIGIYVDKMAAIRALLMVIADLLEWWITQITLHDPGQKSLDEAKDSLKTLNTTPGGNKWYRRLGSLLSFFAMLMCRIVYIWLIYKSDNKSLSVFITLCIEGFWFGVFQMSFFAVGPEFNAFTSFGIHTMGNFIFFLQVILNKRAKKKPKINSLYRVRVHGWVVLVTSVIALGVWIYFCVKYSYGDTHEFTELVKKLNKQLESVNVNTPNEIANKLAEKMGSSSGSAQTEAKALLKTEFGLENASVEQGSGSNENNKVNVKAGTGGGKTSDTLKVKITGGSEKFNELVNALKNVSGVSKITKGDNQATQIAPNLVTALNEVTDAITKMIKDDFGVTGTVSVSQGSGRDKVVVTIQGSGGSEKQTGEATIKVNDQPITIQVQGTVQDLDSNKCKAIAISIVLALLNEDVGKAVADKDVKFSLDNGKQPEVEISVTDSFSDTQANRIAWKLGSAFTRVSEIKVGTSSPETKLKLSLSLEPWNKPGNVSQDHVWSPFWLFIIGAFAEDFSVPGILPFAFLDPEKANLVNYLTPSFFMTGALMTVFLNDFFEVGGFTKQFQLYSYFKAWSEGDAPGWHALWLMNIPKYIAFFIAMWSVHGTYDSLRCIIQSRWRVMLLTMTVVVPRAFLETAGYVGVANYAILASYTNDFDGFNFIAYHDVLAMFCRFVYGKFAVGYK